MDSEIPLKCLMLLAFKSRRWDFTCKLIQNGQKKKKTVSFFGLLCSITTPTAYRNPAAAKSPHRLYLITPNKLFLYSFNVRRCVFKTCQNCAIRLHKANCCPPAMQYINYLDHRSTKITSREMCKQRTAPQGGGGYSRSRTRTYYLKNSRERHGLCEFRAEKALLW